MAELYALDAEALRELVADRIAVAGAITWQKDTVLVVAEGSPGPVGRLKCPAPSEWPPCPPNMRPHWNINGHLL